MTQRRKPRQEDSDATPTDPHNQLRQMAALVAENARLSEELRSRTQELEGRNRATNVIHEIVGLVLASPDASHTIDLILERAMAVDSFDIGVMRLIRNGQVELVAGRGLFDPENFTSYRLGEADSSRRMTMRVLTSQEPLVLEDISAYDGVRAFKKEGVQSAVIVSIHAGSEVLGVMALGSRTPRTFTPGVVELVSAMGRQLGVAIQKAQLHEETRAAEERYRVVSEMTSDFAYAVEIDAKSNGQMLWITNAIQNVTGYTPEEIMAAGGANSFVHPDDQPLLSARRRELLANRPSTVECRVITKAGEIRWIRLISQPQWDEKEGRVVGHFAAAKDITDQKEAEAALEESEERLRQSQKMEAVGMLAGGIAHDFNNLLTVILGFSEFNVSNPDSPATVGHAEEIRKAAEQAAALTAQLLAFSRRQILQPKILNLNAVVADVESLLSRIIGEDIELVTKLDPRIGPVRADPTQLGQVIMNLAANARDAMPEGGQLVIQTSEVELDDAYRERHGPRRTGPHVQLAVSDTGVGMDAEVRSRLFEPFFTTKPQGKGTGLGLAMVYGVVKQSDGDIWVYSEPGIGTTLKIYLPVLDEAQTERAPTPTTRENLEGDETVLVVEDEPAVRGFAVAALSAYGYTVLQAANGREALDLSAGFEGTIDLVLTDLVMPGLSGRQLAEELGALMPETRVLYMSGYTDDVAVRHGLIGPSFAYLQKPFTPGNLAQKVRQVLDAK